jgi:hypothetical protein
LKRFLQLINLLCLIAGAVSLTLLLNLTAPNPTGRRYSSQMPLTTRQGSPQDIGRSGEDVLGNDLRLPNNNTGETQCICGNSRQTRGGVCKACLTILPNLSTYRMPDFVGTGFLAESKNEQGLFYSGREVDQINDYVLAALLMKVHLWVYVRVDTEVSSEFTTLVESTGGGIVYYFTVPGYVDPVDAAARVVLLVSFGTILVITPGGVGIGRLKMRKLAVSSPKPPRPPKPPDDPAHRAVRKTDAAEDFVKRRKEREQQKIDVEDTKDEF